VETYARLTVISTTLDQQHKRWAALYLESTWMGDRSRASVAEEVFWYIPRAIKTTVCVETSRRLTACTMAHPCTSCTFN
jgi:hypothetical protein